MTDLSLVPTRTPREQEVGRRQLPDRRRSLSSVNLRHLGLRPRRLSQRRGDDTAGSYTDWYEARLLASGLGIVVCCCLDAFFTLTLLQLGAVELNALMAGLIESDVSRFVSLKVGLTCLSVVLLVIHKNFLFFNRLRVEYLLHLAFAAYLSLIAYELYLLANPPF